MTISEMIAKRKEYGYSYEYISQKSGVPISTVQKIFGGTTSMPRRTTLEALQKAFDTGTGRTEVGFTEAEEPSGIVCESEVSYGLTCGSGALKADNIIDHSLDDYLKLPDDVRVELIDGVFYDMASPTSIHQIISMELSSLLREHIDANKGSCIPLAGPIDVQLDCDDRTIVQPDVLVVCDRSKVKKQRIYGAPDYIIEILSPSNWYHDTTRKLIKYKNAGVREYWIVMPDYLKILVYFFERSDLPVEYTFEDAVPVNIWDGKCRIDFRKIYDRISFLLSS